MLNINEILEDCTAIQQVQSKLCYAEKYWCYKIDPFDQFLTRGRQKNLDGKCFLQPIFDLPKRTIENMSNMNVLFKHPLEDVEYFYRDTAGFDISLDESRHLCQKAWEENFKYLYLDGSKYKVEADFCICNESENTYLECNPERNFFSIFE